jgi:hypothetical protein
MQTEGSIKAHFDQSAYRLPKHPRPKIALTKRELADLEACIMSLRECGKWVNP